MSDQPKPTSGEWTVWTYQIHDGCWRIYERGVEIGTVLSELNASSLVAAHNAAVVNDQPKPAGEWTAADVLQMGCDRADPAYFIADAHNAALDAEREKGESPNE